MITISGQMDMCNGLMVTHTKGGATQLTMAACAANEHTIDGVMYRLVWIGADAEQFYYMHGAGLRSGKRLMVKGTNPRALIDRGEPVIMLDVLDIQILERGAGEVDKIEGVPTQMNHIDHEVARMVKKHTHGCCADEICTNNSCMELPKGKTCGDCYAFLHCKGLFGAKKENTSCDFFPRRFREPAAKATGST